MKIDDTHILITGAMNSGKTTLAQRIIGILAKTNDVIVFDPCQAIWRGETGKTLYPILRNIGGKKPTFAVVKMDMARDIKENARVFIQAVNQRQMVTQEKKPLILVFDEAASVFTHSLMPECHALISRGRHLGIRLILITQRLAELSATAQGNCREAFLMRLGMADADYARIRNVYGKETEAKLKDIPSHHYIHIKDGRYVLHKGKDIIHPPVVINNHK